MTSARRPSDGEITQETTMAGAGTGAAGGTADRLNLTDDKEEQAAAAHGNRNRSKEEEEAARKKKEEAEAAVALFLEWLRHWKEDVARKKKEEEEDARKKEDASKKEEEKAARASDKTFEKDRNKQLFFELERDKLIESIKKEWQKWENKKDELDKMREWLMVLATIAVSITYAAGLSPPGGMWQDDSPGAGGHTAGTPVLQTNAPSRYLTFYYSNAMSFVMSLVIVAMLLNRKASVQKLVFATLFDIMCLVVAYLAGTTSRVVLSIPLILVAIGAFIYVAYRILILVCRGVLTALTWCLSSLLLLCLPCIVGIIMGCLLRGKRDRDVDMTVTTGSQQNDVRHQQV